MSNEKVWRGSRAAAQDIMADLAAGEKGGTFWEKETMIGAFPYIVGGIVNPTVARPAWDTGDFTQSRVHCGIMALLRDMGKATWTGNAIGWWIDPDTGAMCLDASMGVSDRETAIKLGIERGEKAIYDVEADDDIRCDGDIAA
ncbi:hypothetical protein [Brevibacterium moorei]|uniref:hypothetical protein n=1 Tax=Brevibacterium moorei TaxID=2968457 RepID=UPI00211B95AE|nr:hypothetical protein [Brevibacterium sp. 68QC2CO]MCQ9385132.1 hypothetical protein [Brevibacterium sp. 68QC2CO]